MRYVVANNPDSALHKRADCWHLRDSAVDEVRASDHPDRDRCSTCYAPDVCDYCGEPDTWSHDCETRLHCGACDAAFLEAGPPEDVAGSTPECPDCGQTNIVPTPGVAARGD